VTARIWLDVPFDDKAEAKRAGAWWDPAAKRWYAPRPGIAALSRWRALPPLPELLPGEDRSFGAGLFVDLVPSSCWFTNVRAQLTQPSWDRVRRMVYGRAGNRCEACGRGADPALGQLMEAHERWDYDPAGSRQVLRRLVCLCTACHEVTHIGFAGVRGRDALAVEHLRAVTGMSPVQADEHVRQAFAVWERRSGRRWELDISMLSGLGLKLTPEAVAARAAR
jgi:Domain of unknown function (DUF5710)